MTPQSPKDYEYTFEGYVIEDVPAWRIALNVLSTMGAFLLVAFIFVAGCEKTAHAENYTDDQIVNAIYKAEGTWNYGIKSVRCSTSAECRQICRTTVKRNRQRFAQYGYKNHADFISFLSARYAPIGAKNDPTNLNANWQKNVRFFLAKGGK